MKEDHQNTQDCTVAATANDKDDDESLTHQLQKDTNSEKAAISTRTMDDEHKRIDKEYGENNMLSLIPDILRSFVERSCQAEELIRDGMVVLCCCCCCCFVWVFCGWCWRRCPSWPSWLMLVESIRCIVH
mmetsp:Transcript_23600/g.46956  ORF Transcript_23600/g.46956 Transcript_23600/m.46956 type:complete len:130 (+) Transcript_23600:99-488(+)